MNCKNDKQHFEFFGLIQNFIEDMHIQIMGHSVVVDSFEFSAGAKIHYKLATEVRRNLNLTLIPDETRTQIMIINMLGIRTAYFIPNLALDALNRILLQQYKGPIEDSVNCIRDVLKTAVQESAKLIDQYPSLRDEVIYQILTCIHREVENCKERLLSYIEANMFYINYHHPDFDSTVCDTVAQSTEPVDFWENTMAIEEDSVTFEITESVALYSTVPTTKLKVGLKEEENNHKNVNCALTSLMKNLKIVQKQIGDVALKYIIFFLVKKVLDFIKNDLLLAILKSYNFCSSTEDNADIQMKEDTEFSCKIL